jgi:hypothetical protein
MACVESAGSDEMRVRTNLSDFLKDPRGAGGERRCEKFIAGDGEGRH